MRAIFHIGRYTRFLRAVLCRPDKWSMFRKLLVQEMSIIGIDSIGIVVLLASFMGAVMACKRLTKLGMDSSLYNWIYWTDNNIRILTNSYSYHFSWKGWV